jgi:3-oxoacyl-[acyl-carrier protein] reductase
VDLGLRDKVVMVTGANGGIGSEICLSFMRENSKVVALYRGDIHKLDALKASMEEEGLNLSLLVPKVIDMKSSESIDTCVQAVKDELGMIDILVNNAGTTVEKPFLSLTDDEMDMIYEANLHSLAKLSKRVLKEMLMQKSGNIVNVSSIVSTSWGRGVAYYSAMKAGVNRLTEVLATEVGKKGIRVNAVCPGFIETRLSGAIHARHSERILGETPMKKFGKPIDVSNAIKFLASDKVSSFVTGVTLKIDGGISL